MAREKKLPLEDLRVFEAVSGMGVKAVVSNKQILFGNRKLVHKFEIPSDLIEEKMAKLESEGKTVMILADGKEIAGLVAVADTVGVITFCHKGTN
jgi:cation transport ATPase